MPTNTDQSGAAAGGPSTPPFPPLFSGDPLTNLSLLGRRTDSLRRYLSSSISTHSPIPLPLISDHLSTTLRHVISNASALISPPSQIKGQYPIFLDPITDLDESELASSSTPHQCEICGKSFKRDANLRMHMRAHGGKFKSIEALRRIKPAGEGLVEPGLSTTRFSCPVEGCCRNRGHPGFKPLNSAACARAHYRRTHLSKNLRCGCCWKGFSIMADLKSHKKQCGEAKRWRCSCGTSFSRKDKLFGHVALFEGHSPAVDPPLDEKLKNSAVVEQQGKSEKVKEKDQMLKGVAVGEGKVMHDDGVREEWSSLEFFEGLMDEFGTMEQVYENCWKPQ